MSYVKAVHNSPDLPGEQVFLYRNNLKGRDFGQEAAQIFAFGANCIAREQDVSENQKDAAKLTPLKTDSSGCFGIGHLKAYHQVASANLVVALATGFIAYPILGISARLLQIENKSNIQWYYGALVPYQHFIPVKEDLSDLVQQIRWVKEHDEEAKKIVENANAFVNSHLTNEDIYLYLYHLIVEYAKLQNGRVFRPI